MSQSSDALLGSRVGKIRLIGSLGAGGMGEVYLGRDERLKRDVAVKTIRGIRRGDVEVRGRFQREAEILSQLEHAHVCRLYDLIEEQDCDYLVLERVRGRDLEARVAEGADRATRLRWASEICEALIAAHERDVVHRDLKPGNVMITDDGSVKVLDFGLARIHAMEDATVPPASADEVDPVLRCRKVPSDAIAAATTLDLGFRSRADRVVGTPGYMSPEQARGLAVGPASDIYSLGLLLQWLFTGRPPYLPDRTVHQLVLAAAQGETAPIGELEPPALAELIARCTSLRPELRPTASEVRDELAAIADEPRRRQLAELRRESDHRVGARQRVWATVVLAGVVMAAGAAGHLVTRTTGRAPGYPWILLTAAAYLGGILASVARRPPRHLIAKLQAGAIATNAAGMLVMLGLAQGMGLPPWQAVVFLYALTAITTAILALVSTPRMWLPVTSWLGAAVLTLAFPVAMWAVLATAGAASMLAMGWAWWRAPSRGRPG